MKRFWLSFMLVSGGAAAQGIPGVYLSIAPDTSIRSDAATICRVTALNRSGRTIEGRSIAFEARALENGLVISIERGTFGGIVRDGQSVETLIGFNGVFRDVAVSPAPAGSASRGRKRGGSRRARSGGSRRGKSGRKRRR